MSACARAPLATTPSRIIPYLAMGKRCPGGRSMVKREEDQALITLLQENRQRVRDLPDRSLFLRREWIGLVAVDVDLAQDGRAAPDQHDQLGASPQVACEVVRDRADVGHVLILPGSHRGTADPLSHRDAGV